MIQRHPLLALFLVLTTFVLAAVSYGQGGKPSQAAQTIKWDNYVFKFQPGGQVAQVFNSDGKVIGTILQMNGELQAIPLPGPEADKLKKSFEDWKAYSARSHSGDSPAPATAATPSPAQPESAVNPGAPTGTPASFDAASKTVTLPGGASVTFVDDENVKASIPSPSGAGLTNYDLHYHGGSTGGFLKGTMVSSRRGNAGTSLSGSGVTISTSGTKIFDTADGGNTASVFVRARQIAGPVIDAAKVAGGSVGSSHVVESLKNSNMGLDKK